MDSSLDRRAHAALLLKVLAEAAEDVTVSHESLALLAHRIGAHLLDEVESRVGSRPGTSIGPQFRVIDGGCLADGTHRHP
jgi:hypothetical protein